MTDSVREIMRLSKKEAQKLLDNDGELIVRLACKEALESAIDCGGLEEWGIHKVEGIADVMSS